ncbi:MAG: CDP-glycerol glycerophosphotransferase family protein [Calditrichaceae bacterium]|nr:CDP-glycerol glycerophosphotransferase family protein [Calditrichaceae bacterium]MBN2710352.1 CDP-glycerol glycerophosphotransferase family protein [Calditrichaceae bacterium]RQV95101.1 MAG: CDP-glycerol glycerophosphotransferase [Calditrichota bacterium]
MKKIKILFRIGYAYHKAAFDPVIELLLNNPKYDVWFSLDMEKKRYLLFDVPYRAPIISDWEKLGYRFTKETKGFDIVIAGDTLRNSADYGKVMLIFLNHGTGIKNILYRNLRDVPHDKYQIFVEGRHRVDSLLNSPWLGKNEVHLIGLPKLDFYFQGRYNDTHSLLQKWGLDPAKRTVMYAPTYKPTSMYKVKDDIFEQTRDYNLIIKLHPYSWMGKYASHKQHRIYERRVKNYKHAVLLPFTEYNIVPYYAAADVVMSEASSTVFDFLAFRKFGIIFDLPSDRLKHSDGQPLLEIDNREFLKDAFVHINDGKQIKDAVEKCLNPTESMRKKADEYRERYFYELDGRAAERFIQKMEELYEQGGHENEPQNQ